MVYFHHPVQHRLGGLQPQGKIHHRGKRRGKRSHQIGIRQHEITHGGFFLAILDTRRLDNIPDAHIRGTSHLAALAIDAVFQRFIIKIGLFQPQALPVRTRLFRSREIGIRSRNRTIHRAHGALDTLFKIVIADIMLLKIHTPAF